MARWRLQSAHYLNVPGTKYRHQETDSNTGVQAEVDFPCPRYLDPSNPRDCNSPEGIIVAYAGKSQPRDIIFEGPPTPEMAPLDEEAEEISKSWETRWKHPIESLEATGGSMITEMQRQIANLVAENMALKAEAKDETKTPRRA